MAERRSRPPRVTSSYYFRRALTPRELLPAVGAAIGAGLAAFYVAKLLLQRTSLEGGAERRRANRRAGGNDSRLRRRGRDGGGER
jgi:hypothetical protein